MTSVIYLMTIILQYPFSMGNSFQNHIKKELDRNTPNDISVSRIEFKEDELVSHFIHDVLRNEPIKKLCDAIWNKGGDVSNGYFKIQFESDSSLGNRTLPWLETFINNTHSNFEYLMTYFFYKSEEGFRHFGYFHNDRCDEEMESFPFIESYSHYADLFESYFKTGEVPNELYPFVAKLMLLNRISDDN